MNNDERHNRSGLRPDRRRRIPNPPAIFNALTSTAGRRPAITVTLEVQRHWASRVRAISMSGTALRGYRTTGGRSPCRSAKVSWRVPATGRPVDERLSSQPAPDYGRPGPRAVHLPGSARRGSRSSTRSARSSRAGWRIRRRSRRPCDHGLINNIAKLHGAFRSSGWVRGETTYHGCRRQINQKLGRRRPMSVNGARRPLGRPCWSRRISRCGRAAFIDNIARFTAGRSRRCWTRPARSAINRRWQQGARWGADSAKREITPFRRGTSSATAATFAHSTRRSSSGRSPSWEASR